MSLGTILLIIVILMLVGAIHVPPVTVYPFDRKSSARSFFICDAASKWHRVQMLTFLTITL